MAAKGWSAKRQAVKPKVTAYKPAKPKVKPKAQTTMTSAQKVAGAAATSETAGQAAASRTGSGFVADSTYNTAVDYAARVATADRGTVDEEERKAKHEYGIDDTTNPFSRMALLKRTYLAKGNATTNSMASRGQLYSGSHQRGKAQDRYGEERDTAALRSEYESALSSFNNRRTQISREEEEAKIAAQEAQMARQEAADYDTAQQAEASGAATAATTQTAAQKAKAYKDPTRKRNGQTEYKWPNGTWHTRPWRGN
jgi:hypothetical protein